MLLQRLATGATGVKQARYRQGPTSGSGALVRACAVYTSYYGSLALAVQCETMHGVMPASSACISIFRRGLCTLVLFIYYNKEVVVGLWLPLKLGNSENFLCWSIRNTLNRFLLALP